MARHPRKPPPSLTSGRVLEYACLPKSVPYSGAALQFSGHEEVGWVPCLALEENLQSGEVSLLYCDKDWQILAFSPHDSVGKAKRRAERMYPGSSSHWRRRGVTRAQAIEFRSHQWDGYECSFCRRTPEQASPQFASGLARICGACVEEFHGSLAQDPAASNDDQG